MTKRDEAMPQMAEEMSLLSQAEFDKIVNGDMSAEEAFFYVSRELPVRRFSETLKKFYDGSDLKEVLTNTLITPESNRESIQRSVRDGLSDNYIPDDREIYFKICFALKLSETDAQNFMRTATDGGFHVRNPRELAYLFCLRTGKTYTEAQALFEKLTPLLPAQSDSSAKTELVVNTFSHVATEEQFLIFYDANITALGKMHNTAYEWFCHFLNVLISPSAALYAP